MKTVQISLNSIDKVKSFVNDITKFDYDFDLVSGRYVIDAKSIMGIFSLDLSKQIDLNIHTEGDTAEIMEILKGLHQEGRTVILITHDNEIAAKAKRIIRIMDGRIVADIINDAQL